MAPSPIRNTTPKPMPARSARRWSALNTGLRKPDGEVTRGVAGSGVAVIWEIDFEALSQPRPQMKLCRLAASLVRMDNSVTRNDPLSPTVTYDPTAIEKKWQRIWQERGTNHTDLHRAQRPFYALMMFPYPSAEGLHVGNLFAFTGNDIYARF